MVAERLETGPFEVCAYCGEAFEPDVSYPVVVCEGDAGELEIYSFCNECCEAAWRAEQ